MSEPLKPCPFCGGPAEEDYYDGPLAQCEKCNAGADREAWQRRAPDADHAALLGLVRELRDALRIATTLIDQHSEWLLEDYKEEVDKAGIAPSLGIRADKALAGEPGEGGKQRREDFVAGAAYGGYMDFGKSTAKEAGEQARAEALRRYPEKPQEVKP